MTTYDWSYDLKISTAPVDGKDDVIREVHWRLTATSSDDPPITSSIYGSVMLGDLDDTYVPFDSVTQDQCKAWVLASMESFPVGQERTEDDLKTTLDERIAAIKTPALESKVPSGW